MIAGVAFALVLWAVSPLVSSDDARSAATLQDRISQKRAQRDAQLGRERVLTSDIQRYSGQINRLQTRIDRLRARQDRVQRDLDAKRAELIRVQDRLAKEVRRLARLRRDLAHDRGVLARRLVELYQTDRPDLVTVILNANGFADLLEQSEFLKEIQAQDQRIIRRVASAKRDAETTAAELDRLEQRQQQITARVVTRRDEVAKVRLQLVSTQAPMRTARARKNAVLRTVRNQRHEVEEDLAALERANAQATNNLANLPAQAVQGGDGPWDWPVSGPITGSFGEQRPGHIHAGIDIAVPVGTPIRAVANGRVVLQQGTGASGGYGNYTCLQHTGTLTSCYAHQRNFATRMGQTVAKNQVIGYVGMTGNTTGPHLHFEARVSGTPVNPFNYL